MALVQQTQLQQAEPGVRDRARRAAGSPALNLPLECFRSSTDM